MKHKGLDKLYGRLTPEERFKLDMEAMARGDEEESRRLVETCPRRSYVMNDGASIGPARTNSRRSTRSLSLQDGTGGADALLTGCPPKLVTNW